MTTVLRLPDTAAGAREAFGEMADEETAREFAGAKYVADPVVPGVWGLDLPDGRRAIVYLAGYRTPLGSIREHHDFEVGTRPAGRPSWP